MKLGLILPPQQNWRLLGILNRRSVMLLLIFQRRPKVNNFLFQSINFRTIKSTSFQMVTTFRLEVNDLDVQKLFLILLSWARICLVSISLLINLFPNVILMSEKSYFPTLCLVEVQLCFPEYRRDY